ncbi:MAG TPA: ABC transporter ATP-binding protein [Candidatus Dormibacteraeota bacterium]|nr:ABC transporter ATP-binding protein [Candidatus Dormibacteraeota bacterium]
MLLEARAVSKAFDGFLAVRGVGLEVSAGEIVGIIGPNGAGKSTFFNCLAGELAPTAGSILFDGADVTAAPPEAHARMGMARTFQIPATFPDLTILDNVMVGAFLRHPRGADARDAAMGVLEFAGLGGVAHQRAASLGTPGRKRLEIARALATEPRLLLLDEALAGLTPAEIQRAIDLVREIHRRGVTLVIVEHVMEVILALAQRIIVLNHGEVIAAGAPDEVVNLPQVVEAYLGRTLSGRRPAPGAGPS